MSLTLLIIIGLALSFSFMNGVHDSRNVVATMISSRAYPTRVALGVTALAEFFGPFIFGVAVAQTIGRGIVGLLATDGTLREIRRIYRLMSLLKRAGLPVQKHLLRFDLMLRDMGISEAALQGIRTDLLILYAEHDMIKEDHLQRLAGLVPGARLQKIMGCTHMTIYRHPEAIQAMGDFLG